MIIKGVTTNWRSWEKLMESPIYRRGPQWEQMELQIKSNFLPSLPYLSTWRECQLWERRMMLFIKVNMEFTSISLCPSWRSTSNYYPECDEVKFEDLYFHQRDLESSESRVSGNRDRALQCVGSQNAPLQVLRFKTLISSSNKSRGRLDQIVFKYLEKP